MTAYFPLMQQYEKLPSMRTRLRVPGPRRGASAPLPSRAYGSPKLSLKIEMSIRPAMLLWLPQL